MSKEGINLVLGLFLQFRFNGAGLVIDGVVGRQAHIAAQSLAILHARLSPNEVNLFINAFKVLGLGPEALVADGKFGPAALRALNEFLTIGNQPPVEFSQI